MQKEMSRGIRWALVVIAMLGVAIMGYLLSLHYSADTGGSFCDIGENLSCDIVNKSVYAKIFGIPMSLLGLLYFLGVLGASLFRYNKKTLHALIFLTIVFLGPSLYLSGIEFFVLENICLFCEGSKLLMIVVIILSWAAIRPEKVAGGMVAGALIGAIILGGITYFAQSQGVPDGTYDEFAMCLTEKNFIMYGSQGCSFCARQRALFGSSFEFIHEIECDPRFENPQVELCVARAIEHTPTWIQEDASGNELLRMKDGLQSLEELSAASGCALP
jgi:uncharacterized membrane protein